jgi:hypothetical protein
MQAAEDSLLQESQPDTDGKPTSDRFPEAKLSKSPDESPGHVKRKRERTNAPTQRLIVVGFYGALVVAAACLMLGGLIQIHGVGQQRN